MITLGDITRPEDVANVIAFLASGLGLVRVVRSANGSPDPALPIIMLSAHEEPENVAAARDAGVDAYMIKPVSVRALYDYVVEVMGARDAG